jgi:uncharacterized protein YndB with AHSA1/START domain
VDGSVQHEVRGALRADDGVGIVRIDSVLAAHADEAWRAVTEPARLAQWLGEVDGDLRAGGAWTGRFFPSGWDGTGRVLECGPGHRFLVESAEPRGAPTTDELELTPVGLDRTRVVVVKRGAPLQWIAAFGVGVQLHVENLAAHLAGRPPLDPDPFWKQLLPEYERLAAAL